MKEKFFAYDPDTGLETYEKEEQAKAAAKEIIDEYRENADEGWDELVEQVCWGEIKQQATEFKIGKYFYFDGELADAVDYQLKEI